MEITRTTKQATNIKLTPAQSNKKNQMYQVIRRYETITFHYTKGGAGLQICDYGNLFLCYKHQGKVIPLQA